MMGMHGFSLVLIVLLFQGLSQVCLSENSSFVCVEKERRALMKFKRSFTGSSKRLLTWQGKNCCQWVGIRCDQHTWRVIKVDLTGNQLNGTIPQTLGDLLSLTELYLSKNNLSGDVPTSLGNLRNLEVLDVSHNSLEGYVSEVHLANLSKLRYLDVGFNPNLTFQTRSGWIPDFQLHYIYITNCNLGSRFPQWLRTQKEVIRLDVSNANINDNFPKWLHGMTSLVSLDLSANAITGPISTTFFAAMLYLEDLFLGSNLMNGSIPKSLCTCGRLFSLDLSKNMLSGEIPDCWESDSLYVINLSGNEISGTIPISIGQLTSLGGFLVNNNNLNGELPLSMENCISLSILDVGENQLSGVIPHWIGGRVNSMEILRLRSNMFTGNIPRELCALWALRILDLANNHLDGEIPSCFINLTGMTTKRVLFGPVYFTAIVQEVMKGRELDYTNEVLLLLTYVDLSSNDFHGVIPDELCALYALNGLNLSHNRFSGNIPGRIGNLSSLESLDLSHNNLSGSIPSTMASLTMLAFLNMSFNNLSGQVPSGNQLQTLDVDPSIYAGNPLLCGPTLSNKCSDGEDKGGDHDDGSTEEDDNKSEKIWLYLFIALGYATGLWVAIGTLFLKRNWRIAYFRLAEDARDWVIVMVTVKLARLKNKLSNNGE